MEFWIFLLCVIVLFLAYPYLRCFVKRLVCLGKIRRLCRKKQYRVSGRTLYGFSEAGTRTDAIVTLKRRMRCMPSSCSGFRADRPC